MSAVLRHLPQVVGKTRQCKELTNCFVVGISKAKVSDMPVRLARPTEPDFTSISFDQIVDEAGSSLDVDANVTDPFPVATFPPMRMLAPIEDLPADQSVTVLPNGEVIGRFFEWDACILGTSRSEGTCWTPPKDPYNYDLYHQSDLVVTVDGGTVHVPVGGLVPGHAPPEADEMSSIEHYNDPTLTRVHARAYEDDRGGYIHGCLVPGKTYEDALLVIGSALSGHWIWHGRRWACVGPCLVVRPGLPLERASTHIRTASVGSALEQINPAPIVSGVTPWRVEDVGLENTARPFVSGDDVNLVVAYVGGTVQRKASCSCEEAAPVSTETEPPANIPEPAPQQDQPKAEATPMEEQVLEEIVDETVEPETIEESSETLTELRQEITNLKDELTERNETQEALALQVQQISDDFDELLRKLQEEKLEDLTLLDINEAAAEEGELVEAG